MIITTKKYLTGFDADYDVRYPGYFSAHFNIGGKIKRLYNLKKSDLAFITEDKTIEDLFGVIHYVTKVHELLDNNISYVIDCNVVYGQEYFEKMFGKDVFFTKFLY